MIRSRILTIVLGLAVVFTGLLLISRAAVFRLPSNQQGYEPVQPIAYSHRLHAGELQIQCQYCHFGADKSRTAGIPPAGVCMNCHKFVTAPLGAIRAEDERRKRRTVLRGRSSPPNWASSTTPSSTVVRSPG